jgi:hypothetical protein
VPVRNAREGDRSTGKAPKGKGWQDEARQDPPECAVWDEADPDALNTGILADGLRIIDIDIGDEATAGAAHRLADRHFGPSPCVRRRSGTGRRALLYRAAEGEPPKKARTNSTTDEKVEVLGRGQQLVAYGRHHSGAAIVWQGLPGLEVRRDELPAVSEEQVDAFLDDVTSLIHADPPKVHAPRFETRVEDGDRDSLTAEDVKACLDRIMDNSSYEMWRNVGAAIHAWNPGPEGLELFDAWSLRSPKYDRGSVVRQWNASRGMTMFPPAASCIGPGRATPIY